MIKYLHLLNDSIFADFVIEEFNYCAPNENLFLLDIPKHIFQIKNISYENQVVPCVHGKYSDKKVFKSVQGVFFHSLNQSCMPIINKLSSDTQVFWFSWGYDLYPHCWTREALYLPMTYEFVVSSYRRNKPTFKMKARSAVSDVLRGLMRKDNWRRIALERVDYCSTIVPTEFSIAETLTGFRAKEVRFNYGSLDGIRSQSGGLYATGDNIIIGNSNTCTSNHVDLFRRLADCNLAKRRIIVPLSYGSDNDYKAFIMDRGTYYFGNRFVPILEFLPFNEYTRILSTCGTVMFNNTRQQGLGTLLLMIWLGANVYLNSVNPVYSHLKSIGVLLNDLEKPITHLPMLTSEEIQHNRCCLESDYSAEIVRERTMRLLSLAQR